jgi:hypothetical protein
VRILPAWLREFVDIKADDRQLAEDLLFCHGGVERRRTSAEGATDLSPALQRWVSGLKMPESRGDDRGKPICRAYGTPIHSCFYPALKRWAMLLRPASGTASFAIARASHSHNAIRTAASVTPSTVGRA